MDPVVGVVMGRETDLGVMGEAVEVLEELEVACEVRVLSVHRTPDEVLAWGREAVDRGLRVLIGGAGMAAHLPGVLAGTTSLPVIGVPIGGRNLDGLDALLAVAQMPAGVPVATVAVDGGRNAGLLAARILGAGDDALRARVDAFREGEADTGRERDRAVREQFDHRRQAPRDFGFR